ncbi:L,D-transpeptidase family protein [Kyrpidia tusciae]|uniref:ErfK/YbiS/YcfS/YnhG family protein n=1 Tax=Kyrpidia tusciae (strain DSM 2912 / NBRC 15312 / T2) TaxID=562970 RepID=D5WR19_KYRT2|nr:peptidoglycan-binding protein [Kyrpidia tusciae]ADG04809.1 ErfK/YbiS/YcfS/YnhG family protein [Kyrpidia tusciae DSM 2912]
MILASRFLRLTTPYMRGPDVIAVQRRLTVFGRLSSWDGIYGPVTARAVAEFQRASGLLSDGIVGPATWVALGIEQVEWGGGQFHIAIDTERRVLSLFQRDRLIRSFPVAVGKPTTPTPVGDWVIVEKIANPGGPFGAAWMRLSVPNGGYGIHGTNNPGSVGRAVSHGCVRMHNEDVIQVYQTVPLGTLVTITGRVLTTRLLHMGVTPGDDIAQVQRMLQVLGFYRGDTDGIFGRITDTAVRAFQQSAQLTVDGIVGPRTAVTLESHYDIALGDVQP